MLNSLVISGALLVFIMIWIVVSIAIMISQRNTIDNLSDEVNELTWNNIEMVEEHIETMDLLEDQMKDVKDLMIESERLYEETIDELLVERYATLNAIPVSSIKTVNRNYKKNGYNLLMYRLRNEDGEFEVYVDKIEDSIED